MKIKRRCSRIAAFFFAFFHESQENRMDWKKTREQLPTTEVCGQIKVLMFTHGWAFPIYGLYTHLANGGEWSELDQLSGRYVEFEGATEPEFWVAVTTPSNE